MRVHGDKIKAPPEHADLKLSNHSTPFHFVDNRPEAAAQRRVAEMIESSPRQPALQRWHKSILGRTPPLQVCQLKTKVVNTGQTYDFGTGQVEVGETMESWLDPNDPKQGQSANLNTSQDEMMDEIRTYWGIKGGDVVKGHLLNDNLGGTALNENLYPITRGANKDHLRYVENAAKKVNWIDGDGLYYKVEVDAKPDITENIACFNIEMRQWDPNGGYKTDGEEILGNLAVPSDLNDVRAKNQVYNMEDSDEEVEPFKNPKKPKSVKEPKKRVSELTDMEIENRNNDF